MACGAIVEESADVALLPGADGCVTTTDTLCVGACWAVDWWLFGVSTIFPRTVPRRAPMTPMLAANKLHRWFDFDNDSAAAGLSRRSWSRVPPLLWQGENQGRTAQTTGAR